MMKKTKKKGFSMIEMMVVIAIVAVLVSIVIPIVKVETVKAHAATNAANLRSIEGKLTTMRLQYPDEFATLLSTASGRYDAIKDSYVFVVDILYGSGAGEATLTENYEKFTAANNVLTLYAPNIVITDVPSAKRIELRGSDLSNSVVVAEGTQMTVFITASKVAAAYGYESTGYYTKDVFADIAEDGKFDGEIEGGNTDGGAIGKVWCSWAGHNFDANGICTICDYNKNWHTCKDEMKTEWGQLVAGKDGNCDECGSAVAHECDYSGTFGACTICGSFNHECYDNDSDHLCDGGAILGYNEHGIRLTECTETVTQDDGHHCGYCGAKTSDHNYVGGKCTVSFCGRSSHVPGTDCTDVVKKDHICDVCNTPMTGNLASCAAYGYTPNGATGHKCGHCGASSSHGTLTQTTSWGSKIHKCGTCEWSGNCSDGSDADHNCDVCGRTGMSSCSDGTDSGHECDSCGKSGASSCGDNGYNDVNDSQHTCKDCGKYFDHDYSFLSTECACGHDKPNDESGC